MVDAAMVAGVAREDEELAGGRSLELIKRRDGAKRAFYELLAECEAHDGDDS